MTTIDMSKALPCAVMFDEGRWLAGVAALLMQASLVFWPMASQWAKVSADHTGIERMLRKISDANYTPQVKYRDTGKRFRHAA